MLIEFDEVHVGTQFDNFEKAKNVIFSAARSNFLQYVVKRSRTVASYNKCIILPLECVVINPQLQYRGSRSTIFHRKLILKDQPPDRT